MWAGHRRVWFPALPVASDHRTHMILRRVFTLPSVGTTQSMFYHIYQDNRKKYRPALRSCSLLGYGSRGETAWATPEQRRRRSSNPIKSVTQASQSTTQGVRLSATAMVQAERPSPSAVTLDESVESVPSFCICAVPPSKIQGRASGRASQV